jgi:site-specific DNA-cytosine methylase
LWPYIVDGIKRLGRPPIVFFENVEGILSSQLKSDEWSDPEGTPVLLHVHRELEKMGYQATSSVFSASEIGAPHRRKRVFILGVRNDLSDEGREWVSQRVGYTKGQQDRIRELRHLEEKGRQGSSPHYATWFTSGGFRTAYPAPREAEQYPFEPPRVTLGNTNGGDKGSHGGECWLLPSEKEDRQTDRLERTGDVAEFGDTHYKGLERRCQQKGSQTNERWDSKNVSSTSTGTTSGELQGEAKSEVGGNVDGATNWMGNAELYESCDNRTDELRMLGNGVVPDTARRAFEILWEELAHTPFFTTG